MITSPGPVPRRQHSPASRFAAAVLVCALLVAGGVGVGYVLGQRQSVAAGDKADLGTFWKAWGIIDKKFFGDTSTEKRLEGAISGMVAGLGDPYTTYLEPKQNKVFQEDLQGSFGGIGSELSVKSGQLVIMSVLDDTPSSRAGLRANDVIISIDGAETADMSFVDAIDKIRGDEGSTVKLSIGREGEEKALAIDVIRDVIVVKSVITDKLGTNKDIGYIKVNQFGQDTSQAFRQALVDAKDSKGVVIDLRNNPGGYLNASLQMIGMVLPQTPTKDDAVLGRRVGVTEKDKDGDKELPAGRDIILDTMPLVILVNEGSASASEIFAGAMKDYARAKVIGVKTFGKGSVQELQELGNGGSIKVTVAKWYTPLGTGIDGTGIEPDMVVELPEDVTASKDDVQVKKALEILTQK
ncbi:MAG TPA: S41 family peptidase [Verrucomicrobiae bacterium]|nr:S41 family peptidase [Verrucomicrobiae bacterium]